MIFKQYNDKYILFNVLFLTFFFQFVRWENSKRLLFGSLVCLSYDNFESFLFATVSDRDPKQLQKGLVQITFTEESRVKLARIQVKYKRIMLRCDFNNIKHMYS